MSEWTFKCKDCGGKTLHVVHTHDVVSTFGHRLACTCDANEDYAAYRPESFTTSYQSIGQLDDQHRPDWFDKGEKVDETDAEQGEEEILCHHCVERASDDQWETVEEEPDQDEEQTENEEFFVRCAGCNRDIEFGWSHPDRGGRIWPAECSDFNPWLSWPEARYREAWAEKNWLRPPRATQGAQAESVSN